MTKVRFNRVRCRQCNSIVGADLVVKQIERCLACHTKVAKKGTAKTIASAYARVKKGPALDLPEQYRGFRFRSSWERNFARVLTKTRVSWEYESPKCQFFFPNYKRGAKGYLCDFYLTNKDEYYEVKGYFSKTDKSKIRRLKKHYPEALAKLTVVLSKSNKPAIEFYNKYDLKLIYYEDLIRDWKDKIKAWE